MPAAPIPGDEGARLAALRALRLLDTAPEERFDRLTRLARRLFGVPMALLSLVDADRQWFKSALGVTITETPREVSFCGHAILRDEVLVVRDAALDPRFADNPLVTGEPGVRFYAGCALAVPDGSKVGTLCVIDREPREFDAEDLVLLKDLARMAEQELAALAMATVDELCRVCNRRGFEVLARHALSTCKRQRLPATLLFFDLDRFKQINDRFGHAEGDRALVDFAALLKRTFRDSDVIGRLGGDEFVVLLTDADPREQAGAIQRLVRAVAAHNAAAGRGYELRFSVGSAAWDPADEIDLASLMAESDVRMYEDKATRRAESARAA